MARTVHPPFDNRDPTEGQPNPKKTGARVKYEALRLARQQGHRMANFRPAPCTGPGELFVSWCKVCEASIIWRTRPFALQPTVEGSAMTRACVGEMGPGKKDAQTLKKTLTRQTGGV